MPTDKQLQANRENAQDEAAILSEPKIQRCSTGPRTEDGKAKSSMNAVKTGLTGRTVLLPGDDVAAYREHLACLEERHKPANDAENMLVQSVADIEWRLARIPSLEAGIYAIGRMELGGQFAHEEDATVRRLLTDAKVFLTYQRQLNNLSIQESRLRRQREKDLAELKRLQAERAAPLRAMPRPFTNPAAPAPPTAKPFGFDFSSRLDHLRGPITCREFGPSRPAFGNLPSFDTPTKSDGASEEAEPLPCPDAA